MMYCYTHKSVPHSLHIILLKANYYTRGKLTQRPKTGQFVENERLWGNKSEWDVFIEALPKISGIYMEENVQRL